MGEEIRKTGIDIIGDVRWGTHFCQFYQTKEDLIDILVPYFKAGLENNEFCMWVTSEPLNEKEAEEAMIRVIPDFTQYLKSGQIEIIPYTEWYTKSEKFDADEVLQGWVKKEKQALKRGFDGLRLTGNTFWLERKDWKDFSDYEEEVNSVIGEYRMLAICTYSLDRCGASEVIDVVSNHQFALIRREGKWELIESSERKRSVEALRESEGKYRALVEEALVGVMNVDIKGKITYVNKTILQSTGYLREELVGKNAFRLGLVSDETIRVLGRRMRERLAGKPPGLMQLQFRCKDGGWIWLEIRGRLLREHGLPVGIQIIGQNITERKQAEEELLKNRNLLNETGKMAKVGGWEFDVETLRQTWTEEVYHIHEVDMDYQPTVKEGVNFYAPEAIPIISEAVQRVIDYGEPFDLELPFITAKGNRRWVHAIGKSYRKDGKTIRVGGTFQDITERKQAEEREKRLQQELSLASRLASVGELAAGVAHEINNPLTGILAFSERLLRKSTDEKASRDLKRIHNEAGRVAKVVEHFLTFARRREPKKENSDVNRILRRALQLRAYELKTSNIEVETDLAPGLPGVIVDPYQIQEVFLNIIMNAEQTMTEADRGGKLGIKTQQMKNCIRISFTDDGPGIPAEHLDKIFDPFFTTRGKIGGTGLGLSVCHGIVQRHDGRIYARSKPGKGATFVVELPLTGEKVKEAKRS